jgi:hypothetical protein
MQRWMMKQIKKYSFYNTYAPIMHNLKYLRFYEKSNYISGRKIVSSLSRSEL